MRRREPVHARDGDGLTPLVGRDAESGDVAGLWQRAKEGQGQFALISGEAGIGKSRIVEVLQEKVAAESHTCLTAQCWSHFRNSALQPLVACVLRSMGIDAELPHADKIAALESALAAPGCPQEALVPVLASFLGIPLSPPYQTPQLSPDLFKSTLFDALAGLLLAPPRTVPGCSSSRICTGATRRRWSCWHTVRARDRRAGHGLGDVSSRVPTAVARASLSDAYPLARLSTTTGDALVRWPAPGRTSPPKPSAVRRRSDGIPLFIEELAAPLPRREALRLSLYRSTNCCWRASIG